MQKIPWKKLKQWLSAKRRVSILDENTSQESWYIHLSVLNILAVIGGISLAAMIVMFFLVRNTILGEWIPVHDENFRKEVYLNLMRVDSLQQEVERRDRYTNNVISVLSGMEMTDTLSARGLDSTVNYSNIRFVRSSADSLLRRLIEEEERFNFADNTKPTSDLPGTLFFTPVSGVITEGFDYANGHFGVDIVAAPNTSVKSVLDGTVIATGWTFDEGQTITIQHINNLVSVYKHNSRLLRKSGDAVNAGETIAIVGNPAKSTSSANLHFELWHDGKPLNPTSYVTFQQ